MTTTLTVTITIEGDASADELRDAVLSGLNDRTWRKVAFAVTPSGDEAFLLGATDLPVEPTR